MSDVDVTKTGVPVAADMWFVMLDVHSLREADVNAQVMEPTQFERLVQNVAIRGSLESVIYCAQPACAGPVQIISGHHRYRAARAAGLRQVPCLVDVSDMTRSTMTAKQIAHNALVGQSDTEVLRRMVATIDAADDLLATGLDVDLLPTVDKNDTTLLTPQTDFEWRTVAFTFLPHHLDDFKALIASLDGAQDLVGAAPIEQYEPFTKAVAGFSRIRDIKAVGIAVAELTRTALAQTALPMTPTGEPWVQLSTILGSTAVDPDAAKVIQAAVDRMLDAGDITEKARWRAVELWAADYLGGPGPDKGDDNR